MSRISRLLALALTAVLPLVLVVGETTSPSTAAADGGEQTAGTPRAGGDRITAGDKHSCVITSDGELAGSVYCWGNNALGQLGQGDTANRGDGPGEMAEALARVELGRAAVSISAGTAHTCVVLDDGSVKCWGYDSAGQLGLGDTADRGDQPGEMGDTLPAVDLGTGRTAIMVSAGVEFTCALLDDGSVKCWGDNSQGQLGLGDTADRGDQPGEMGDTLPAVALGAGRTAIALATGGSHACAVLDTHQVKCWGNGETGQLGLGDTADRGDQPGEMGDALPMVDLGTDVHPIAITAGRFHTCVLVDRESAKCWGANTNGQLGLGDTATRGDEPGEMGEALPKVTFSVGTLADGIAATSSSTCAFGSGMTARCWGANSKGQLAAGHTSDVNAPAFAEVYGATGMGAGDQHMCWSDATGTVRCAGANDSGQLGLGDTTNRGDVDLVMTPIVLRSTEVPLDIAAGYNHQCFLLSGGRVRCVGNNAFGQLGLGDTANRGVSPSTVGENVPTVDLGTGRTAKKIAAGQWVTCAILDNDQLKCWGANTGGQLGLGDIAARGDGPGEMGDALPAIDLGTGRHAMSVSIGQNHVCAVLDNGTLKCWGNNDSGRLGLGAIGNRGDEPGEMGDALPAVALGTGRTALSVATGFNSTCAVLDTHQLKCWGYGGWGSLGYGSTDFRGIDGDAMGDSLPVVDLGTGRTVVQVDMDQATCARLDNGQVKCWGHNDFGVGGQGDLLRRGDEPGEMGDNLATIALGTGRTALEISVGYDHACARLDDATVKCWGGNYSGQLGLEDTASRGDQPGEMGDALPATKLGGTAVVALDSLDYSTCATLVTGRVKCWGSNLAGQMGIGQNGGNFGTSPGSMANTPFAEIGGTLNRVLARPARPGVPSTVTATPAPTSATLTWAAPDSGGSPITGYRIERSTDGGVQWTVAIANTAGTATSATITGLTNGTGIRFRVAAINAVGSGPVSIASPLVVPVSAPGAPTSVVATAGDGTVTLTWSLAANNGLKLLGHRIEKSTDNGATWSLAANVGNLPSTTISGLANFVPVRFRVSASNLLGPGPVSAASTAVTPITTKYWPLRPTRLADTRPGSKTGDGKFAGAGALKAGGVMTLRVVGRGGVPGGAKAATLDVTVIKPAAAGSLSVYPCGSVRSTATTISFAAGVTVTNTALAKVGSSGNVCIRTSAITHVAVDVRGVQPAGSTYIPLNPARLAGTVAVKAGAVLPVKVAGRGGAPTTAKAATLNVTVVKPAAAGRVTVYACGSARPALATIVFAAGVTTSNMAISRIGTGGSICVHSSVAAGVQVDVIGAHPTTTTFHAVTPTRLATKSMAAKGVLVVNVAGKAGVPVGTRAAVVNITVAKGAAAGALTIYPCGTTRPAASATAYRAGTTVSQTVIAGLAANGTMCVYTTAAATITVDVSGNV